LRAGFAGENLSLRPGTGHLIHNPTMTPTEQRLCRDCLAEASRAARRGLARDRARAKARQGAPAPRLGRTGVLCRSVDAAAYTQAAILEGPEVNTAAGEGWWQDQMDRHPHLRGPDWRGRGGSLDGLHNRHGRVTTTYRDGRWWLVGPNGELTPDDRPGKLKL